MRTNIRETKQKQILMKTETLKKLITDNEDKISFGDTDNLHSYQTKKQNRLKCLIMNTNLNKNTNEQQNKSIPKKIPISRRI